MNFKIKTIIFILLLFISCEAARAEIYEPGRGILLPKRERGDNNRKNTIQSLPQPNKAPAVVNKNGIVLPKTNSGQNPVIIQPQNRRTDDAAQKLTSAYASHLYTSVCAQDYRDSLAPLSEPNINRQKMWTDIQASCKCLSSELLSVVPAPDLADYVMYNYGAPSAQDNAQSSAYYSSQKSERIDLMSANAQLRKKCGFLN